MADTLKLIQTLPPELREVIYKEYIKIKLRERKDHGWEEVHTAIKKVKGCNGSKHFARVTCAGTNVCGTCHRNGRKHYFGWQSIRERQPQMADAHTLKQIQKLPPELQKEIRKEYIKMIHREREDLGWEEVHEAIKEAPVCIRNEQIVKVLFCYKCSDICLRNNLCNLCYRNGRKHYLGYPIYDEDDYDECFKKSFDVGWCGAVA